MEKISLESARALMVETVALIKVNLPRVLKQRYEITLKEDGSPVTKADVFLENLISDFIKTKIQKVTVIGEESYVNSFEELSDSYFVVIDPIDGTENFCSGLKEWGVSFSLWHGREHLGSFLFMPELDELLMTGDSLTPINSRIHGFSSSMCQEILDLMTGVRESRVMGCAVYNIYNVIRGSFSRFTNPRGAYVWDLLPGLMLALEHQCEVKVNGELFDGEFLNPNQKYRVDIQHRHNIYTR